MLYFENDYCEGAHPAILQKLTETNFEKVSGYGTDPYCASAREKIRAACACPEADVQFISGGTQSNAIVIASMLQRWQGVVAAATGHVAGHEAGAIEYTGHKVLEIGQENGKINAGELRAYMEQTRHLRHDFRQHLHVIAGLTEAGQVDELKNYLHQYESELSEERPTLCANPAVDALAGHYDHEAHSLGVPVDWRLELPRQLAIPEADFCMMLGNLLENAFHASQKLPPEQRQVKVMARMLSPAMLGLLVENRYDGVLKRQQGTLHSTKHDGMGIGLVSIQTAVSRYGGSMTVETENCLFRVNILLNL